MREDWKEVRLKDITILNPSINEEFEELVSFIPMENLRNGFINYSDVIQFQEAKGKYTYFSNGDLLIAKVTPCFENGNIAIAKKLFNKKGFGSSEIFVLRTLKNISEYFLFYYCQSISFREKAISTMYGVAGLKRIPSLFMRTYSLHLPPITTQHAITNYLDEKLAVIDRYILLLEKKRDYYTVLRKSLINKIVRYGLNPDVELKDSGIEWLGEIPKHWDVKRVKAVTSIKKGKLLETVDEQLPGYKPLLSLDYLRNGNPQFDNFVFTEDKDLHVTENDVIVVWDGAGSGDILKGKEGILSSTVAKISMNKKLVLTEFFYFLRFNIEYKLKSQPTGMGIPHINSNLLKEFEIPIPPLSEQQTIACYLDAQSEKIDRIVANINMQLGKLTKLKKSLINECVTGERIIQI